MAESEHDSLVDKMAAEYGEYLRLTIEDALRWLEVTEPDWGLEQPIDKEGFLRSLLSKARRPKIKNNTPDNPE